MTPAPHNPIVVKVGGSLYDMADLGARLRSWLDGLGTPNVLLVPGGGRAADLVRSWDVQHGLGEEKSHLLALHALAFNARFLASILPGAVVIERLEACLDPFAAGLLPILDLSAWAENGEHQSDRLPHSWDVTSDALAALVALQTAAQELILLKSVDLPAELDWEQAVKRGIVDAYFPTVIAGSSLKVRAVNFRQWK